ncbi:GntP family permease [Bradyrhizobium lablabi]|uniref:GntP family permease n=1 Tax=Bradyrhizobium lablabi TaxID=722472 RepID=UPI001BACE35F|nr:GntP family permease [Bradyrhizobium lablabi]MBR0697731.1 GntP family permease [Bradyrhizobium lablabi]
MGLLGILVGLGLLIWLSFRGWSVLLLAPVCALVAAAFGGQPLLANWTQTFMTGAAAFLAQFFPIFLLGAVFGKLMDDSGAVTAAAGFITRCLGERRVMLAVVLAGALVTYGGISLFVAFFVIVPMAQSLFRKADIPHRLVPAAVILGTSTFTMSALPGTPSIQNAIPMPFFGTTPFAAPGLGILASIIMLCVGLWWLLRAERAARSSGEGYGDTQQTVAEDPDEQLLRQRATTSRDFDPAELRHGYHSKDAVPVFSALAPLVVVFVVNLVMSFLVLPRLDFSFLGEQRWGNTSLSAVSGVWSVVAALTAAIVTVILCNWPRLPALRQTMDAGANASVLPALSVASLVGFGAVVASLPAFGMVQDWVLRIEGGPLVSLAVATNLLAGLTGSASGGLTIALDALGQTFMDVAAREGIAPALLHRVAVIGSGTLDILPHNGAVVSLLAICGLTHRQSYLDIVMVGIVSSICALTALIVIGSLFGSF